MIAGILVIASLYLIWGIWHQVVTKRNKAVAIVVGAVLVVMALTNPDEEQFRTKFGEQFNGRISIGVLSVGATWPTREQIARMPPKKDGNYTELHLGLFGQVF